jgi:hypothetical protein
MVLSRHFLIKVVAAGVVVVAGAAVVAFGAEFALEDPLQP